VQPKVFDWLEENGYSPVYGARPLKRLIQTAVLNPLAMMLLKGQVREGERVAVEVRDDDIFLVPNHADGFGADGVALPLPEEMKGH